jgi:hypothetical protein
MHPSTSTYVENGLLSGVSDLSTFVPFLSAFFIAFLSFFSFFFFSSFFLPMLFVPCHLRYGRIIHQLFWPFKHSIFGRLLFRNFLQTALSQAIRRPEWEEVFAAVLGPFLTFVAVHQFDRCWGYSGRFTDIVDSALFGTFETCRRTPTMSVPRGNSEVAFWGRQDRL